MTLTKTVKLFSPIWASLGDVPIDSNGGLEEQWRHFPIGTPREEVWHWLEEEFNVSIGKVINNE